MKLILFVFAFFSLAEARSTQQKASDFFNWLNKNEKLFVDCQIQKTNDEITLCDHTKVSYSEVKKLFALSSGELIKEFNKKNIQVEVVSDSNELKNKTFKKVSSLHGLYLPDENKIIVRSGATTGVLIHEYLHFKQSTNQEKIDGHIYKGEKNKLRNEIESDLDQMMVEIKSLEQKKDKQKLNLKASEFIQLNNFMVDFGKWQDLIDERSLFLLFLKFEKDFSIPKADIELAQKNLKFICNRKDLKFKLSTAECEL